MALVKLVDEADATGLVKEVYDDILRSRNLERVPNYWKALAHQPDFLAATWHKLKTVVDFFNGSNAVASGLQVEYEPSVPRRSEPS
ncbi:MAG TPA: hypothetical protein VMW49_08225 [Candidatus Dormibacteraeota bacterium]|nr:hypothetical protein [Candidatus Dormibacteraeota bacterium]